PPKPQSAPRSDVPATQLPTVSMARPDLPATRPESQPAQAASPAAPLVTRKPLVSPVPLVNLEKDSNLPPMADAFAALLAEELNEPPPSPAPTWHAPGTMTPAVTDDLVDQVTRRVLERLADRVVRDSIVDVVSKVAERLVREEIERIKSSIK